MIVAVSEAVVVINTTTLGTTINIHYAFSRRIDSWIDGWYSQSHIESEILFQACCKAED